jgi:hypothetical protein
LVIVTENCGAFGKSSVVITILRGSGCAPC